MKKMITKTLILSCLFLTSIFIRANDTIPHGKWEVTQFTIEKNTDGRVETVTQETNKNIDDRVMAATDNALRDMQSFIPCPQEWEIKDSKTIVLRFSDETEITTEYIIFNDTLSIRAFGAIMQYRYEVSDTNLTLTLAYKYKWNSPSRQVEQIEEKWVIILTKQE